MGGTKAWLVRGLLFVAAVIAPAVGYGIRATGTGNAETAIDGLGWGLIGTSVALICLAITFRTSAVGRLGRLAVATVGVLLVWLAVLGIANI